MTAIGSRHIGDRRREWTDIVVSKIHFQMAMCICFQTSSNSISMGCHRVNKYSYLDTIYSTEDFQLKNNLVTKLKRYKFWIKLDEITEWSGQLHWLFNCLECNSFHIGVLCRYGHNSKMQIKITQIIFKYNWSSKIAIKIYLTNNKCLR